MLSVFIIFSLFFIYALLEAVIEKWQRQQEVQRKKSDIEIRRATKQNNKNNYKEMKKQI